MPIPHTYSSCGEHVDKTGLHGLSCQSSQGRIPRHKALNYISHRSLASVNIPSRLESSGLYRANGSRPDGVTISPWSKFLVWDAMCVDTCTSHKCVLAKKAGGATALAEEKERKYTHLDRAYLLQQVARVSGPRLIALSTRPWSCTYLLCVFNFIIVVFSGIY